MTQSNQFNRTKVFMFGLLISATTLFASCAPKYGCGYGMLEVPVQSGETCDIDGADYHQTSIVAITSN